MFKLNDKVAIVTGSGSPKGIGRNIALTLAKQGATIVVADLNVEGIQRYRTSNRRHWRTGFRR